MRTVQGQETTTGLVPALNNKESEVIDVDAIAKEGRQELTQKLTVIGLKNINNDDAQVAIDQAFRNVLSAWSGLVGRSISATMGPEGATTVVSGLTDATQARRQASQGISPMMVEDFLSKKTTPKKVIVALEGSKDEHGLVVSSHSGLLEQKTPSPITKYKSDETATQREGEKQIRLLRSVLIGAHPTVC